MSSVTIAPASGAGTAARLIRRLPYLGLLLAVVAIATIAAAPLGWHAGWWHFRTAFWNIIAPAAWIGAGGAAVSLAGLLLGRAALGRRGLLAGIVGLVVGGLIAWYPYSYYQRLGVLPPIHDITTDMENPPEFSATLPARQAEQGASAVYEGAKLAEQQKKGYPDIQPLALDVPPAQAFQRALDTAKARGLTIVESDPAKGRIEASQTSRWFHFTDDCVIRVAAAGAGSRVDMRCLSRQGRSDFGVNADRIRAYMAALKG